MVSLRRCRGCGSVVLVASALGVALHLRSTGRSLDRSRPNRHRRDPTPAIFARSRQSGATKQPHVARARVARDPPTRSAGLGQSADPRLMDRQRPVPAPVPVPTERRARRPGISVLVAGLCRNAVKHDQGMCRSAAIRQPTPRARSTKVCARHDLRAAPGWL